jgi:putative hydrolase of the HAD superfamily
MKKKFDAIAFDIDGTLYPNYRFYYRLIPFVIRHFRLLSAFSKSRKILRRESHSESFYDAQARIAAGLLRKNPAFIKEKFEHLIYQSWQSHFKGLKMYPYVRETIENLRSAGYKTGVLSDFPVKNKLKSMNLEGIWDAELCSEQIGELKPALKAFQCLAEALSCPPERVLYVGNSVSYDVIGAKNAGMKAALIRGCAIFPPKETPQKEVLPGVPASKKRFGGADFVFQDYRQLECFVLN